MPEGLLEILLKLLGHLLSILKLLPIPPKVAGTVSLLPPLIGAAQVSWKFVQNLSGEHKKKVLRERILGLQNFLKSLSETELTDKQTQATQDARRERDEAMGELARLAVTESTAAVTEPSRKRNWVRRTLLLYAPKPRAIWILHALFYFFSLEFIAILLVAVADAATGTLETAADMIPALAVFLTPVLLCWGLASDLDRSGVRERNLLQRWLLLYAPQRRLRWVWHVLFYLSLMALGSLLMLLPEAIQSKDVPDTLFAIAMYLLVALLFRGAAVRPDRNERKFGLLSHWLLLYAPRKRWVWILHVLFWTYVIAVAALSAEIVQAVLGKQSVSLMDAATVFYAVITMFIFWGLASDLEQDRQGPPGALRRAFLLYVPDRGLLWILHILFYLTVVGAVIGLGDVATGHVQVVSTTTGEADLLLDLEGPVYLLLLAFVSRTLAVGLEPWAATMPGWVMWFWLGGQPRGWLRRLGFLLSALAFYASVALWPPLVFGVIDDLRTHERWTAFVIPPSVVVVGLVCRWVARRLQIKESERKAASQM